MRVQFSVSESEWQQLLILSKKRGYPDVPSYCKDTVLQERTYAQFWNAVCFGIRQMEKGKTFALRDIVDAPPANLGVKLFEHQAELGIEVVKKDNLNSNTFRKL